MEEKLFFNDSQGNKLCGILSKQSNNKSNLIVILIHGFNSGKNSSTNLSLVERLNKNNISTFRIDLFAHGESEGEFENLTQSHGVDNVLSAINFLKKLGYSKIGLVGSSFGGLASTIATSKTKDILFLALKCPVSSYFEFKEYTDNKLINDWKAKGYSYRENKRLNYSFYEDIKNNIAYDVGNKITVPTLIVHGDKDNEVSIEQSIKLCKLIPNCKLVTIKGAGHGFSEGNTREQMLSTITTFILENIN